MLAVINAFMFRVRVRVRLTLTLTLCVQNLVTRMLILYVTSILPLCIPFRWYS